MRSLITILLILGLSSNVLAHSETAPTYNRINLNEQAASDVDNDLLVAVLFVQKEGRRADLLAREINKSIDEAVTQAKKVPGVKVQTLSYRTNATYKKNAVNGWRVHQSIRLESQNSEVLGELIGKLQNKLSVQSIGYQISDDKRREHTDELIGLALKRFQQRASNIAKAMGHSGFKLVRLTINNGRSQQPPVAFSMAASRSREAAPVRIEAGTQRVEITVNGEIELGK